MSRINRVMPLTCLKPPTTSHHTYTFQTPSSGPTRPRRAWSCLPPPHLSLVSHSFALFQPYHLPLCPEQFKLVSTSGPLHLPWPFPKSPPGFFVTDSFRPWFSNATFSVKLFLTTLLKVASSLYSTTQFHFLRYSYSKTVLFCWFVYLLAVCLPTRT